MALPTTQQVIDYITANPGCKSKQIAKHFGCTTSDINKQRDDYPGAYKIAGNKPVNYCHFIEATVPVIDKDATIADLRKTIATLTERVAELREALDLHNE